MDFFPEKLYSIFMFLSIFPAGLTNGDMRKVYWYAPVDYVKVVADITGKFVADPSENLKAEIVPIGGATEFDRGQVRPWTLGSNEGEETKLGLSV